MIVIEDPIFGTTLIDESAYVDNKADVVGEVIIHEKVIIAAGASIRGDEGGLIEIGKGSNLQDQVTFHGLLNQYIKVEGKPYSIFVGSHCTIAHCALVHGPSAILKKCFVGPQSQIWVSTLGRNVWVGKQSLVDNAIVGNFCYIGVQAAVMNVSVPDNRYIADFQKVCDQKTADQLPEVSDEILQKGLGFNKHVVDTNKALTKLHKARQKILKKLPGK